MAKQAGLGDAAFIDGYNASCDICMLNEIGGGPSLWDVTTICKSAMARQGLQRSGRLNFQYFYERDTAPSDEFNIFDQVQSLPYADRIISYFRGEAVGNPAACMVSKQVTAEWRREQNGALTGACNSLSNGFSLEWCQQLTAGEDLHASATNGASIDAGAASLFGGAAYWHVMDVASGTVEGEIQDSADNVTFATVTDLVFAGLAVPGKERVKTAQDATIRRYRRFASTGTFTNARLAVAFIPYEVVTPN